MHLKLLFSLLSLLFLTDSGGSGDGDGNDDSDGNTAPDGDENGDDLTEIKAALDKERKSGRATSKRANALEKELNDLKNAGKSEADKIKTAEDRATAAEQRLQLSNARSEVTDLATKANVVSVKAVFALIRDDIEYDDEGEPTNIASLMSQAKKDEPHLFRASGGSNDGGKTGEAKATDSNSRMNDFIRQAGRTR